jgi:hypothetical protein
MEGNANKTRRRWGNNKTRRKGGVVMATKLDERGCNGRIRKEGGDGNKTRREWW